MRRRISRYAVHHPPHEIAPRLSQLLRISHPLLPVPRLVTLLAGEVARGSRKRGAHEDAYGPASRSTSRLPARRPVPPEDVGAAGAVGSSEWGDDARVVIEREAQLIPL